MLNKLKIFKYFEKIFQILITRYAEIGNAYRTENKFQISSTFSRL